MRAYLRKDLLNFKPYHAPVKAYDIKIDANENPFVHCKEVLEAAKSWLADKDHLTRYPDTDNNELREKISQLFKVKKENVTATVGSDQLIDYIIKAFIEPGDVVLAPNPSFSMYELSTTLNHGKTILYDLEDDFSYNCDRIKELYALHHPKIVFICTPNNPTGSTISNVAIEDLLQVVKCPVVVDEAYGEFVGEGMIAEINRFPQMVVIKTFSKAFGLAGLRVGYGIASEDMIEAINICKSPYNLSSFSSMMACSVLEHIEYYMDLVLKLQKNCENLYQNLMDLDCFDAVYPTKANFILVKAKELDLCNYLEEQKILARGYGSVGPLGNCIRLTVGTQEENDCLIETIKRYIKK